MFKFTEAVSFQVVCDTQEEIDSYWDRLLAGGGSPSHCGWLKDRFGVSWQVFPQRLLDLTEDAQSAASKRALEAMLQMQKIDLTAIERAHAG